MILTVRDVLSGADLSGSVDRQAGLTVEATFGSRMDILSCTLFDPDVLLALPDRREVVLYDIAAGSDVVDPPFAVSPYNTYLHGIHHERVSNTPSDWTPRLFAGYLATPQYTMSGPERNIHIQAQDYTFRLRSTIANQAFEPALTDATIVKTVFRNYRPDFNTDNVVETFHDMPAISFPVHSLEQFMQRVVKITRAVYRVDYYKRLWYGNIGQFPAPFNLAEAPNEDPLVTSTTYGYEQAVFVPDSAALSNKVWIVGRDYQSATQTYKIPTVLVDGTHFQYVLPGSATKADIVSVTVNGVAKSVGEAPQAGDITDQTTFKNDVIVQPAPPTIAFKVTPGASADVEITGKFRYPLIQIYTDPALVTAAGGVIFEAVVRDKRIRDLILAQKVGKAYLQNQGNALKGWSGHIYERQKGGVIIAPGQTITIDAPRHFAGLGSNPKTFLISRTNLVLDDTNDLQHPYRVELELADRMTTGGQ